MRTLPNLLIFPFPRRGEAGEGFRLSLPPRRGEGGRERGTFSGFARGVGIEKALSVRQGIEKVFYGKDSITVRFRWSLPPDGKMASDEADSAAAPCAALRPPCPSAQKAKGSDLIAKSDPFGQFDSEKKWS
jgi:hypothetical protein